MWFEPTDVTHVWKLLETNLWKYLTFTSPNFAELQQMVSSLDQTATPTHSLYHRRRLHGGDRPHGQKVVGAMPPKSPHRNFVILPLYTAQMYSKNYECDMKVKKVR